MTSNMKMCRKHPRQTAWILPGVILLVMPKCPVCIAGYIAFATGIGVSLTLVEGIRAVAMTLCATVLAFTAIKTICRFFRKTLPTSFP